MRPDSTPGGKKAAESILAILGRADGPMTTREVAAANQDKGIRCPDGTVRFLMSLRTTGVIQGGVSMEKGGWIWWLEDRGAGKDSEGAK